MFKILIFDHGTHGLWWPLWIIFYHCDGLDVFVGHFTVPRLWTYLAVYGFSKVYMVWVSIQQPWKIGITKLYWGLKNNHALITLGSTSLRHQSDAKVSDRCLIDVEPRVFPICMLYYSDIFKWISWAEYISILIQNLSISFQLTEQDLVNIE